MKKWFCVENMNGVRGIYRTESIDYVGPAPEHSGIRIIFPNDEEMITDTYDMVGFASEVLQDEEIVEQLLADTRSVVKVAASEIIGKAK